MDNAAEPYDLITVLLRLESFKGMASEISRGYSVDDLGVAATDGKRTGLFQKILASLQRLAGRPRRSGVA
jgi:hypothetical protein